MVEGFRHVPGNHCGSTALRNLLAHAGVELTEEMAFGLGAGAGFYYVVARRPAALALLQRPRRRSSRRQFCELTGLPLWLQTFDDAEASWGAARDGRRRRAPAAADHRPLLPRPLRQLGAFPGPRGGPRRLRRRGRLPLRHQLRRAADDAAGEPRRGAPRPPPDLPARRAHVRPARRRPSCSIRAGRRRPRSRARPSRCSSRPWHRFEGLPALERFAGEVGHWPEQAEDWQWCARFGYQVIERRGTGGGNFRLMYSRFLAEAGIHEPESALALDAAERWTDLAGALERASEEREPDPAVWARVGELARRCSRPRSASGSPSGSSLGRDAHSGGTSAFFGGPDHAHRVRARPRGDGLRIVVLDGCVQRPGGR